MTRIRVCRIYTLPVAGCGYARAAVLRPKPPISGGAGPGLCRGVIAPGCRQRYLHDQDRSGAGADRPYARGAGHPDSPGQARSVGSRPARPHTLPWRCEGVKDTHGAITANLFPGSVFWAETSGVGPARLRSAVPRDMGRLYYCGILRIPHAVCHKRGSKRAV